MKVQDVRKECSAIVGLSLEFSNSEVGCISRLLWEVDNSIEDAISRQTEIMRTYKDDVKKLDFEDNVPVTVDLRAMKKIQWLLYNMTRVDRCDLFNEANREYEAEINSINNSIAKSKDA